MPGVIDPETTHVDDLPGVWSQVQWELTESEKIGELEQQAQASLLWAVDNPETILRLLLNECEIERAYDSPRGYNPDFQGEWNENLITFRFKRDFQLIKAEREKDYLFVEYKVEDLGYWSLEISPENVNIQRI